MPASDGTGTPESKPRAPSRAKAEALLAEIAELSSKTLPPLLRAMFDQADANPHEIAKTTDESATEESSHLDAASILRDNRVEIEARFDREIKHSYKVALQPASDAINQKAEDDAEFDIDSLSLVEDENLEGSLAAQKMAHNLRDKNQDIYAALDKRLEHLITPHNSNNNDFPATPESVCNSFNKALSGFELDMTVRQSIFKLFENLVVLKLDELYRKINALLASGGILPHLETDKSWRNQIIRKDSPNSSRTGAEKTAAPAAAVGNIAQQRVATQNSDATEGISQAGQGAVAGGDIDHGLLASLQNLLNSQGSASVIPIQPEAVVTPGESISQVEPTQLLTGLTGLQLQQSTNSVAIDSNTLKNMLAASLQKDTSAPVGFQYRESMLIDMIAMLFEFILDDSTIPETTKEQIARLQIPMVKAALIDESFLARKENSARQLLNRISQACTILGRDGSDDSPLLRAVIHVVDTITEQFESDMSIFDQQLGYLTGVLEKQNREIEQVSKRITGAKAKKEEELRQHKRIKDDVQMRLSAVEASPPICNLLESTWEKVLIHTGATLGTDSELWQQRIDFIDLLVDSLKPHEDKDAKHRLMRIIPDVVSTLRSGMLDAGFGEDAIEQALKVIEPMHMAIITSSDTADTIADKAHKHHAMVKAMEAMENELSNLDGILESLDASLLGNDYVSEEVPLPAELLEEATVSQEESAAYNELPDDEYIETVRSMEIGQMVILHNRNNQPVRARLSWKSDLLGEYIFTNWRHKIVAERTLKGLAVDLYQGKLELLQDSTILERALDKVMSGLKQQFPETSPATT